MSMIDVGMRLGDAIMIDPFQLANGFNLKFDQARTVCVFITVRT